ncbi:MAG: hypothetical protein ACOYNN_18655, partial [Terrimicrobiaceae bacterium]
MATINPFQPPINYAVDVQSPFEAALGGFRIGAVGAEAQARALEREDARAVREQARAAQEQARLAQEQYQAGLNSFFAKPPAERTFDELQRLMVGGNKQQLDALKLISEGMSADKLNNSKRFTSQLLLAFEANLETAKTLLRDRMNAETDPVEKRAFQDILTIADQNPEQAARLVESLGAGTFGEDRYKGITAVRAERRTAAREPEELKRLAAQANTAVTESQLKVQELRAKLEAEPDLAIQRQLRTQLAEAEVEEKKAVAAKAVVDARVAEAIQPFKISEAQSQSIIKAAEAKFAPEKFGLEIGLTRAQIDASKA